MEPLETVLKYLESIGFNRNKHRFNKRQLGFGLENIFIILLLCLNLFYATHTREEYINNIVVTVIVTLVFVSRLSTVHKTPIIFVFIDQLNRIVDQSKKFE